MLIFMVLMALITLYFYLGLTYSAFMMNYYEINWFNKSTFKYMNFNLLMIFSSMNLLGLFFIASLYCFNYFYI